jgi:hypothetical protein
MASNTLRFWRWSMQLSLCFVAELAILGAVDTRYVPSKTTHPLYLQDADVKNAKEAHKEANRFLGGNLTPEELTRIEITDMPRDRIIAQMQQHYSKSSYIDDLLMANYHLTGKKDYLEQVIKQYPQGDRIEEAQFLLSHSPS